MAKHLIRIVVLALSLTVLSSCFQYNNGYFDIPLYEGNTDYLTLKNYSSESTIWLIPDAEHAGQLPSELSDWLKTDLYEIEPRMSRQLSFDSTDGYVTPAETYGIGDKMVIYVFKKEIWDNHGWEEIVEGSLWCNKYTLSVDDALNHNKTIIYP